MNDEHVRMIGLVVEAEADARTVQLLVDRTLSAAVEWATPELLDDLRAWRGIEPATVVTFWKKIPAMCKEHGVVVHGKFGGTPDARAGRRVLLLFERLGLPDAIVLVRDADSQRERLRGLQQARARFGRLERVAVGVAIPEREAWILAGFEPSKAKDHEALAGLRRRLGFDPTRQPERLGGHGKREAKAVLRELLADELQRQHEILATASLEQLADRGRESGLAAFLKEVGERVASVLTSSN